MCYIVISGYTEPYTHKIDEKKPILGLGPGPNNVDMDPVVCVYVVHMWYTCGTQLRYSGVVVARWS